MVYGRVFCPLLAMQVLPLLTSSTRLTRRLKLKVQRLKIYRVLCEGLERVEGIPDAIECFHQMASELGEETIIKSDEAEWFHGKTSCMVLGPL